MILILGGTSEGKQVARWLQWIDEPFIYSSKTHIKHAPASKSRWGALDIPAMKETCRQHDIHLIIDAAHPFATTLHQNVFLAARELQTSVIRYERKPITYPEDEDIRSFDSFNSLIKNLQSATFSSILALTGVKNIARFKPVWSNRDCYFKILNTPNSLEQALNTGISPELIISGQPGFEYNKTKRLIRKTKAKLLITKESGTSGYFEEKYMLAREMNIPLWVVKRPSLPNYSHLVYEGKDLLSLVYHLRQQTDQKHHLTKSGYTTGTCVTAAAAASLTALFTNTFPENSQVILPDGTRTVFPVFAPEINENQASCRVIKDAGDDPDITHAREIGCIIRLTSKKGITFRRGEGIGKVTLPGLPVTPGEPAINPVPRQMIRQELEKISKQWKYDGGIEVKPFIPKGKELAKKTFNPRIGITGGLSILGTTGHVIPYSREAYLASLYKQIDVAHALHLSSLVLTSGKRSERILKPAFRNLPSETFVHYGNYVGEILQYIRKKDFQDITLGMMLGKAIKLAEGKLNTHSKYHNFNPLFASAIAEELGYPQQQTTKLKTLQIANAIPGIIPFSPTEVFYKEIARRCIQSCQPLLNENICFTMTLIVKEEKLVLDNLNPF